MEESGEILRQSLSYSSEIEQLELQNKDLVSQKECLVAESEALLTELKTKVAMHVAQSEDSVQTLAQERRRLEAY